MERDAEGGHGRGEIRVPASADRLAVERQSRDALSLTASGQVLVIRGAHAPRQGSVAADDPVGQSDPRPVEVAVVREAAARGGEGVEKRQDHRGGAAGRAHEGLGAGRVRRGFHHARILTDVDERSGGELQPQSVEVARCEVGFGVMLGPLP